MSTVSLPSSLPSEPATSHRADTLWPLYVLFFLSGISGLMYEVVWVRMLTRVLGSTVSATATVLAAFMAGLALGSILSGRFVDRLRQPLRWYALLELGIGLTALGTLTLLEWMYPVYQAIYDFAGGSRAWLTAGQVVASLLVLLLPTALMGATLPTLCVYGTRSHLSFGRCVGFLYSLNTLGALVGVLASGFVLIGAFGETLTLFLGVLLNLVVAALAGLLARAAAHAPLKTAPLVSAGAAGSSAPAPYPASCRRALVAAFALSGFAALASEVIWSRMLLLYQGPAIYSFSSMLAVVLAGMGVGSLVGGRFVHRWPDPLRQFARLQLASALAVVCALHLFAHLGAGVFWPALVSLGPLSLLWGLSFPLAAACMTSREDDAGRNIAALYSWNTCGCIAGSLCAGFVLLPLLGCSHSAASLAGLSLLLGFLLLWIHPLGLGRQARAAEWTLAGMCVLLLAFVRDPYYEALAKRMYAWYPTGVEVLGHFEDATATTTVFRKAGGTWQEKQLWINGEGMTYLAPVTKLMAHLPIALVDEPRNVLVICFGMGTTVRSASSHSELKVRAVELVPAVLRSLKFFHPDVPRLLEQPNVQAVADDGRNYLLMHPQKYDVITIDPPPPLHSAGTVNLYCREFFALCRARLSPGGVLCVWVQPDSKSENKMIFQTFLDVFEHVRVWAGPAGNPGWLLLGTQQPLAMAQVPAKIRKLYESPGVVADLRAWGDDFDRPEKILDLYSADERGLRNFCGSAPVITDDHPYTEFPLWRSLARDGEFRELISARPYKAAGGPIRNPYE